MMSMISDEMVELKKLRQYQTDTSYDMATLKLKRQIEELQKFEWGKGKVNKRRASKVWMGGR